MISLSLGVSVEKRRKERRRRKDGQTRENMRLKKMKGREKE
jgi:hypothetical protein